MNNDTVKGKWTEIKGEILNAWGKLTEDELDQTKGNLLSIAGLIRQHYGEAKEDISNKLSDMFNKQGQAVTEKTEEVKEDLRQSKNNSDDEFQSPKMPKQPANDPLLS